MKGPRPTVWHRWNLGDGEPAPEEGWTVRGRSTAHSWRVVQVVPVDSPVHPNAWRLRLERLGLWDPARHAHGAGFDRYYPNAREQAELAALRARTAS